MQLAEYSIKNFRRLEDVTISLEKNKTLFVGANNAGKTSATAIFKLFTQRTSFRIHDFSAGLMRKIDGLSLSDVSPSPDEIPYIELELWFTVDPKTEYGRIALLMPALSSALVEVGLRLRYSISDLPLLLKEYDASFPAPKEGGRKPITHYLGIDGNLKRHFSITYSRVKRSSDAGVMTYKTYPLDAKDGRATLASLLRVDFVEAQRNIDDDASSRSNQLSSVFYDFYESNLTDLPSDAEALRVIEKSNSDLTDHYRSEFVPLMEIIAELGYPTLNDRDLKVISNLSPEKALGGNALLSYQDPDSDHLLPEAYNGLGFKNLVYIAIQIAHFQIQWGVTEKDRPLCHLIFIEEPEVHLHVQVQQTFLIQIAKVIKKAAEKAAGGDQLPQLVLTTHSSHIVSVADFYEVRYFRKIPSRHGVGTTKIRNVASEVLNLAAFDETCTDEENLTFLKKYLALPHCDLFFADGAIMVEGTVERLILPQLIRKEAPALLSRYLTTLQLGGAYAHRFTPLLEFLGLPCLIITDLDSVDPSARNTICIGSHPLAVTANASIKTLLLPEKKTGKAKAAYDEAKKVAMLNQRVLADKVRTFGKSVVMVAYQTPVSMPTYGGSVTFVPRTFEESFIFHNFDLFHNGTLRSEIKFDAMPDALVDYFKVHNGIHSDFAKVDFVLSILGSKSSWATPQYCVDGLQWLDKAMSN
jgi:putative ATP-dependent endonuclease of the OLD family